MNTLQIQDAFQPYYADRKEPAKPDKPSAKAGDQGDQRKALNRLKDELRKSDGES